MRSEHVCATIGFLRCYMLKKWRKWTQRPGQFSKVIVIFCLAYSVRIIEWGIRQFEETQMEASTLLTVAIGLFGGELLFLCLKRVFSKKDNSERTDSVSESQETEM